MHVDLVSFHQIFTDDVRKRRYPTLELVLDFGTTILFTPVDYVEARLQILPSYQDFKIIQKNIREPVNQQLKERVFP